MKFRILIIAIFLVKNAIGQVSSTGCYLSGALIDPGSVAGCGNGSNYCNLASLFVPAFTPSACGTSVVSGGTNHTKTTSYTLPAGCTATIEAEFRKRNNYSSPVNPSGTGCSNSGMDGTPDGFMITQSGGVVSSQGSTINVNVGTCGLYPTMGTYTTAVATLSPGCSNADGYVNMVVTGGSFTISGASNRADEIITFTINLSGTCGSGCSSVLPITLTDFYGNSEKDGVRLNWHVATQKQTDYYLIEKSFDGENWTTLNAVYANKEYFTNLTYQLYDEYPLPGINYYRLIDVDDDGSKTKHPLIMVNHLFNTNALVAYLNNDYLVVKSHAGVTGFTICDMTGRPIKKVKTGGKTETLISKSELANGLYTLIADNFPQLAPLKLLIY